MRFPPNAGRRFLNGRLISETNRDRGAKLRAWARRSAAESETARCERELKVHYSQSNPIRRSAPLATRLLRGPMQLHLSRRTLHVNVRTLPRADAQRIRSHS